MCAGALPMLSCRSQFTPGFCREGSRHTVEEPRGQTMKMQLPWPLQQAQHVKTAACHVVLVAEMALTTQLALVIP